MPQRVNLTLDDDYIAKLDQMADRAHLASGTLARSLLCEAIDHAAAATAATDETTSSAAMTAILAAAPGFAERFDRGMADARAGRTVPLDEL